MAKLTTQELEQLTPGYQSPIPADLQWRTWDVRFYLNDLPRLVVHREHVHKLRETVLNLAIRGQLVPQEPNEEPATQLLERIALERTLLMNTGEISRGKVPMPAEPDALEFTLPQGWAAASVRQIVLELQTGPFGGALHQSDYRTGGVPVINPASLKNGRIVPVDSMAVGPETVERLATFKLRAGDIVMARRGEMGRCAVVSDEAEGSLCGLRSGAIHSERSVATGSTRVARRAGT